MGHSTIAITADLCTHLYGSEDDARQERVAAAFLAGSKPTGPPVVSLPRRTG